MLFVPKMTSIGNTCSNLELHTNLVGKSRRLWLCLFSLSREMFLLQFLVMSRNHSPQAVSIISQKKTIMIPGRWVFPSIWTNRCPEAEADDRRGAIILGGCLKIQPFDTFHTYAVLCLWYHNIPFYTIPCHTIPYHTIPYHATPYCTILYQTKPYLTIPLGAIIREEEPRCLKIQPFDTGIGSPVIRRLNRFSPLLVRLQFVRT